MRLTIRLEAVSGRPPEQPLDQTFEAFPVVIGRSSACDFVLNDPGKYISSNHATVLVDRDQMLIQDTSSNGTYLNGSTQSIGHANTIPLANGDSITIGDFSLRVEFSAARDQTTSNGADSDAAPTNAQAELAHAKVPQDPFDPFQGDEQDWTPASSALPSDDFWPDDPTPVAEHINASNSAEDDWHDWPEPAAKPASAAPVPVEPRQFQPRQSVSPGPRNPSSSDSNAALNRLLRGAGLNPDEFVGANSEQVLENAGRILGQSVEGMMLLLHSRTELKNAIRTDVTRLSRTNNNPLKFSTGADEAMKRLLMPETQKGYLNADDAINETMDDLKAHQLAMLEGMKAAVRAMLLQFDPDRLEEKLEASSPLTASIPITRDAKLWQLFNEHFHSIRDEAMTDFNELFGKEFRKAYDRRIHELGRKF